MRTLPQLRMFPLATTWMDLEDIVLSEISQIRTNVIQFHSHVESKKQKPQTKQKEIQIQKTK